MNGSINEIDSHPLITVNRAYNTRVPATWSINERSLANSLFYIFKGGSGSLIIGDDEIKLNRNMICIINPGINHSIYTDKQDRLHFICIHYSMQGKSFLDDSGDTAGVIPFYHHENWIQLIQLSQSIYSTSLLPENMYQKVYLSLVMSQLLLSVYKPAGIHCIITPRTDFQQILDLMEESQKYSINDLAAIVNLTPKYFIRKFREFYGISPYQYQIYIKINNARHLLNETNLSIKEIAHILGYIDQYAFSRQFKKIRGYAPSVERILIKEKP